MKNQLSKEVLFNYFAGRSTALQKQAIDEWAKDDTNREFFFDCLTVWEQENLQFIANDHQALKRHQQRISNYRLDDISAAHTGGSNKLKVHWITGKWGRWMMAASVSVILLLSSITGKDYLLFTTHSTAFGEIRTISLSDGSFVTLNANSSLRVPRFGFGNRTRDVVLTGEANFSIKHLTDNQRFVVQTDKNFEVVVLGTEFLVNTRQRGTKVVLTKGKVRLTYQEGKISKQLILKPGNLVTFDQRGRISLKQTLKPKDHTSWETHRFVFKETPLTEISNLFAENYGIDLQIPDKTLTHWTISGAFTAYSAEELIETIAIASNLTYQRKGNTIIITQDH